MVRKALVHVLIEPRQVHSREQDVVRRFGRRIRQGQPDCLPKVKLMMGNDSQYQIFY